MNELFGALWFYLKLIVFIGAICGGFWALGQPGGLKIIVGLFAFIWAISVVVLLVMILRRLPVKNKTTE